MKLAFARAQGNKPKFNSFVMTTGEKTRRETKHIRLPSKLLMNGARHRLERRCCVFLHQTVQRSSVGANSDIPSPISNPCDFWSMRRLKSPNYGDICRMHCTTLHSCRSLNDVAANAKWSTSTDCEENFIDRRCGWCCSWLFHRNRN